MSENGEIPAIVDEWTEKTRQRLLRNLKARKIIGQFTLVSDISYQIKRADQESIHIVFSFEQKKVNKEPEKKGDKWVVKDPLFGKYKPIEFDPGKRAVLSKRNIYKRLEEDYFQELVNGIAEENVEIATNLIIQTINPSRNG